MQKGAGAPAVIDRMNSYKWGEKKKTKLQKQKRKEAIAHEFNVRVQSQQNNTTCTPGILRLSIKTSSVS